MHPTTLVILSAYLRFVNRYTGLSALPIPCCVLPRLDWIDICFIFASPATIRLVRCAYRIYRVGNSTTYLTSVHCQSRSPPNRVVDGLDSHKPISLPWNSNPYSV